MEPDFASVWSRVSAASEPEAPEAQLRRFLLSEAEDICMLRTLSDHICDACVRSLLTGIRTDKLRQMKRLRAALYLLAGECECPPVQPRSEKIEPLPMLKALYERVGAAAAEYRKAAAGTDRLMLETVYSSLSEAEKRHEETLLECTGRVLNITCRTAQP